LIYHITIKTDNEIINELEVDALDVNVKLLSTSSQLNDYHYEKYQGLLYNFKKTVLPKSFSLEIVPNAIGSFKSIKKMDIYLKQ
jgi:hypothetical protein